MIPTVLRWREGYYRPACQDFAAFYTQTLEAYSRFFQSRADELQNHMTLREYLDHQIGTVLVLLQAGHLDAARTLFDRIIDRARSVIATDGQETKVEEVTLMLASVEDIFGFVVAAADRTQPCPVRNVAGKSAHPGYWERVDFFRFNK
ncbi:MAG: hypothetical protein FD149_665 [Rhodospirillaceae bacterium]|nr:MAG: hypothetical protein FD149_665 [Rhodospirillaceae bacterium]